MMFHEFLLLNKAEILASTKSKLLVLTGVRPNSEQLEEGLPIFYRQLMAIFKNERDIVPISETSLQSYEEAALIEEAGRYGKELLRLGYTLTHVVHAYGSMCQAITEMATTRNIRMLPHEFQYLNRCLDITIGGAVSEYQSLQNANDVKREIENLGLLAHELRNALSNVNISLHLIKNGTVGFNGSVGKVLNVALKQLDFLIERSMTEVRLRTDSTVHQENLNLLQVVNQIVVTAEVEAKIRHQVLEIQIDPMLNFQADPQLFYSALSNLVQNALKFTRTGGKIQIRSHSTEKTVVVEVEDECGGLEPGIQSNLFQSFEKSRENRSGLGLGLTISQRAIVLNKGILEVINLPGKGCIFKITLPR